MTEHPSTVHRVMTMGEEKRFSNEESREMSLSARTRRRKTRFFQFQFQFRSSVKIIAFTSPLPAVWNRLRIVFSSIIDGSPSKSIQLHLHRMSILSLRVMEILQRFHRNVGKRGRTENIPSTTTTIPRIEDLCIE